jgi:hypothetical protein
MTTYIEPPRVEVGGAADVCGGGGGGVRRSQRVVVGCGAHTYPPEECAAGRPSWSRSSLAAPARLPARPGPLPQVLSRCSHPNIVRLLAACVTPPRLCLVMELMETSLDRLIHRDPANTCMPLSKVRPKEVCVSE